MDNSSQRGPRYRFGPFELIPEERKLLRNGGNVKLQDLPCRLLVMLVERQGEIVTREELRLRLWATNTFVEFDNSLGVAVRKVRDSLGDDAETPRYIETLPRRGYRFLAPVTVNEGPESGIPASHPEPIEIASSAGSTPPASPVSTHLSPNRYWLFAALVVLLVGAVIYEFRSAPRRAFSNAEAITPHVRIRRSIAVMGFRNLPGRAEDNWLSAAFTEMLSTELAAGGELRVVSGEDVARAKREMPLADEDSLAKATLARLRKDPGADVVVVGSYTALPSNGTLRVRLDIRAQDTAAGETVTEESVTGNESDLFDIASQAGTRLRQSLGVGYLSAEKLAVVQTSLPSNLRAVQLYTEGRAKLWAFDFLGARELLTKAVAADPNYALSHSALSEACWHLGYGTKAKEEAQRAVDLSAHLPREEQLLVEGQYRRSIGEWSKSVEAYQSLAALFPDSLDYGLLLASAQTHVNVTDALRTLETLRRLPPPAGEDARIDMEEASAWIGHDIAKAQAAAKLAITKGRAQGSHVVVARTYGILCQQETAVGTSTAEALANCENARESAIAAGDGNGEATMLTDLAGLHYTQGDLDEARAMWKEASKKFREVGDVEGMAAVLNNLGADALLRGDVAKAKKMLEDSIPNYQATGDKEGIALAQNNLGDLARERGNLEVAATIYRQAQATAQEIDDKDALGYVFTGMGNVLMDRGDLEGARKSYEESLAARTAAGEKQMEVESDLTLAQVSVEVGHASDAEAAARKCKQQFHSEGQADDELTASGVLAEALIAQGKVAEAASEIESSSEIAAKNQNFLVRLQFAVASAHSALASGQLTSAGEQLKRILAKTRESGYLGVELEADLALAELEKRRHSPQAKAKLLAVEKAARAKGFILIAAKASTARQYPKS